MVSVPYSTQLYAGTHVCHMTVIPPPTGFWRYGSVRKMESAGAAAEAVRAVRTVSENDRMIIPGLIDVLRKIVFKVFAKIVIILEK